MRGLGEFLPRDRNWHPAAVPSAYRSTTYRSPRRPLVVVPQSIGELSSPVFGDTPLDPEYATALFDRIKAFRAVDHDA